MTKITNRKAFYEYFVLDSYISGIILDGSEVKSIRNGDVSITEAYILFIDGEVWIRNMRISRYKEATIQNHDELRDKKLLLSKKEISQIENKMDKGITIIPLELFSIKNRLKLKIGVCKGKRSFDKRESIKAKDIKREIRRDNNFNI